MIEDVDQDTIARRVDSYYAMQPTMALRQVVLDMYRIFGKDQKTFYKKIDDLKSVSINGVTVDSAQMQERFKEWIGENNSSHMSIEQNHQKISKVLPWLLKELAKNNVDYYLAGALPCYLKTGTESIRYHDDIDMMLNEEDIPKVQRILEKLRF